MTDDLRIEIQGVKELQRALREVDRALARELRVVWNRAAEEIVRDAATKVPVRTGRAKASVRARSTQTEGRVVAGSNRVPYFPWLEFGGRVGRNKSVVRPYKREGRYVYPAVKQNREKTVRAAERELRQLFDKVERSTGA